MRFRTYVLSRCCKSRSGAYVAMAIRVYMLQVWPRSAGWWLVLICCERKILLSGWWLVLNWCERKTLLAGWHPASRTSCICFKCFSYFQTYVASVLSGCYIRCSGYTRRLQVYVLNVSAVSEIYCKCFIWILRMLQWLCTFVATVPNILPVSDIRCGALHVARVFITR
jgi:hypothetical protein